MLGWIRLRPASGPEVTFTFASGPKSYYNFTSDELEIVLHSRKTLLFWKQSTWIKKHGNEDFDIPIGCYDRAEICELVGIYIQSKLCKLMNKKDFGLYRGDRLGILKNTIGPEANKSI